MKSNYIITGLFLVLLSSISAQMAPTKKGLLPSITNLHIIVFGKDNLITQRITMQEATKWYDLLKGVNELVKKNDPRLLREYQSIANASNEILNTLKVVFNSQIAPALVNEKDKVEGISKLDSVTIAPSAIDLKKIKELLDPLLITQKSLKTIQNTLKPGFFTSGATTDAMEVLKTVAFVLDVTIDKIFIDYKKVQNFVSSAASSSPSLPMSPTGSAPLAPSPTQPISTGITQIG